MSHRAPHDTVSSWLQWRSLNNPKQDAVVTYDESMTRKSLSYLELYQLASRFSFLLKEKGLCKGDNVVISLTNCLEQTVASLGIILAGGVQIAAEVFLTTGETFFEVLEKTKTKFLIVHKDESSFTYNLLKDYLGNQPGNALGGGFVKITKNSKSFNLEHVFVVTRNNQGQGLLEALSKAKDSYQCREITPEDPCVAASTASPTSMVRLVLHTHGSVVRTGLLSANGKSFIKGERNVMVDNPGTWVTAIPYDYLIWGLTRVILDHWAAFKVKHEAQIRADVIEKEDMDMAFFVPPDAEEVASHWKPRAFPMLKHLWTGGMPITEEKAKKLEHIAHKTTVRYISSEVPSSCYNTWHSADEFKEFDCGLLEEGCQVRATDEHFRDVGPKKQGCLLFKTPGMFSGYIGEPNDSLFTPDNWYISNDAGFVCPNDGHLKVVGRNDDMISHNVWILHPTWLEKDFLEHRDVFKVAVVPIPDETNFHNICACIVRRPGSNITADDMRRHFKECYVDDEEKSFGPSDVLFFDKLPEKSNGQMDRQRAIEIAVKIVQKAQADGISTDDLKTIVVK